MVSSSLGNDEQSSTRIQGYDRWKWLQSQTIKLPVTRIGSYLSPVLPCRALGARLYGSFVAEPADPTKHPILYSRTTRWVFIDRDRPLILGFVTGHLAQHYCDPPDFQIGSQTSLSPTEMRSLLVRFGALVDEASVAFFSNQSIDSAVRDELLEICDKVFHPTELSALSVAFSDFFALLDHE